MRKTTLTPSQSTKARQQGQLLVAQGAQLLKWSIIVLIVPKVGDGLIVQSGVGAMLNSILFSPVYIDVALYTPYLNSLTFF
jgi:hypothetical protein